MFACIKSISYNVVSENPEDAYHLLPDVIHHSCHVGGPWCLASQDGDHVATLDRPGNNINFHLGLIETHHQLITHSRVIVKPGLHLLNHLPSCFRG